MPIIKISIYLQQPLLLYLSVHAVLQVLSQIMCLSCVVSDNCTFGISNGHEDKHKEKKGSNVYDGNEEEEFLNGGANDKKSFECI